MLISKSYKWCDCGYLFLHKMGGFILQISTPQCPKCESKNAEKIKSSK